MNTILCSILLLSVTTLILIDADCVGYPNVSNADFHRNEQCSDIVEMTCSDGYKMEAAIKLISEMWKYQKPVCKLGQCMSDPEIENGALDTDIASRDIGIEYSYTCNPGFGKYGNEGHVICTEAGEWEANITCEDPEIENGALDTDISSRDIGIEYSYTCNPGFGKYGNDGLVICTEAREWEANITCEDCFKYTWKKYVKKKPYRTRYGRNQISCRRACNNDDRCTTWFASFVSCELHGKPTIAISRESLRNCKKKCAKLADCELMSWNFICTLFNVTMDNLPRKHKVLSRNGAFIGENLCK
ncbi:hypothetical protein LOTGIDRAFT_153602 [Lottia gigantea]|uniref:Sushi domain-containing protein n=1 Tax=Lottia gigantea TaxID=225164 RepID=V4ACW6_LOTGI|nr:hypothetical protein LOTGIDRAFT_153602 [Lottia gigantea]ESO91171.1 hypothetical protein LOTGIDRAFT_153602 [Lottia gigantea]